jgi:prepilin-type N-terminal cleavage/methylation domain-containing protein
MMNGSRRRPRGFTLIELLVVITIIGLVSIATLPVIIPAYQHRQISESARVLQAAVVGARDAALRAEAPRGIRLLADPAFPGPDAARDPNAPLAFNRWVPIEPANDHTEGFISLGTPFNNDRAFMSSTYAAISVPGVSAANFYELLDPVARAFTPPHYLISSTAGIAYPYSYTGRNPFPFSRIGVQETRFYSVPGASAGTVNWLPNPPTSWFWNIRQGDKIRFDDSGRYYTIAGPMLQGIHNGAGVAVNPERYINFGMPGTTNTYREFLFLVNGLDDDGDGLIDEGFDGIDNDGDGVTDPGFNGIDDNGNGKVDEPEELYYAATGGTVGGEYEPEQFLGNQFAPHVNLSDDPADYDPIMGTQIGGVPGNGFIDEPQEWFNNKRYTIIRRPVVTPGSRETVLPSGVVIDATTWNAGTIRQTTAGVNVSPPPLPERSRLPIDPYTQTVDIMVAPSGQITPGGAGTSGALGSSTAAAVNVPFYHFWLAEREDVFPTIGGAFVQNSASSPQVAQLKANPNYNPGPTLAARNANRPYLLPMPEGTSLYEDTSPVLFPSNTFLKGQRRLVTLFTRTGQTLTTDDVQFLGNDTNYPYYAAQAGAREAR